jgi:diguanylate cyclase (GGDEF)-like protein
VKFSLQHRVWIKFVVMLLAISIVAVTGFMDYRKPYLLGIAIVYLLPVILATWFVGRNAGIAVTGLSGFAWLLGESMSLSPAPHVFFSVWNAVVLVVLFSIITLSLSSLKSALEKEKLLSRKDFLTGAENRLAFYEKAEIELNRCRRYGTPFTVAYFDCDNFKEVNDKLGHHAGDEMLRLIAETIKDNIRAMDMVARIGGDEFVILLPEFPGKSAQDFCNRIRELLLAEMRKRECSITFSLGIATFNSPPGSVDELVAKADNLMYGAKKAGKNTVKQEVFS